VSAVYVHPGQLFVSAASGECTTILGSCVAVCLHDPVARVGGLNHFLLPSFGGEVEDSPRYAPAAVELLVQRMLAEGARQSRLVAHVVGGAAVLAAFSSSPNHLGARNVSAAYELLAARGIKVTSRDVGGTRGRKVVFVPRTGSLSVALIGAPVHAA
jgi:chemotaxis protein CheD